MATAPHDNKEDLDLFLRNPNEFLLRYQETLQIIVKVYIQSGMFRAQDMDDILQTVNEELLRRFPTVRARFNGTTNLRTYLSAVVRNICISHYRADMKTPHVVQLNETLYLRQVDVTGRYDIEHARHVFRAILKEFDYKSELPRLLFCLKLKYRLPIQREDVLAWYPGCSKENLNHLLEGLSGDYGPLTDKEISRLITPVLNRADNRENTPEAIQRWVRERISNILDLLNGSPPTAAFDQETLKILVEDFFSPFLDKTE
jgi:RNA polymerase sigma factor (sigma-70 family)